MTNSYWLRQIVSQPLFPELAWSKPENKLHAGKLLIIGGNLHGFSAPASAYTEATRAGAGATRVVLPTAIQKIVGGFLPEAEFAASTPSGSFAQPSLDTWLNNAAWADAVLLPGDFGRNSETAIVLEAFITKYTGQLTITKDALDYFTQLPRAVLDRPNTTIVASFAQLQKLATHAQFSRALTFDMDMLRLVDTLHELTTVHPAHIVVKHLNTFYVASEGRVSTTKMSEDRGVWRLMTATHASVWWMQHPKQAFEAITSSLIEL